MRLIRPIGIALLFVNAALAANVTKTERYVQDVPMGVGGTFVLENAFGDIEIVGADEPDVHAVVVKTMVGVNDAAINEARNMTQLRIAGDEQTRILRTLVPLARNPKWSATVDYQVRVPRTAHVRVSSTASSSVRITNITGNVFVTNFSGTIYLKDVFGAAKVESTNGSIIFDRSGRLGANAELASTNGDIQVRLAPDASFDWIAETIAGGYRTTFQNVRGHFSGSTFRGTVNAPGGPTLHTASLMGRVFMLKKGTTPQQSAELVRVLPANTSESVGLPPIIQVYREQLVIQQRWTYEVSVGSVWVNEIRGDAFINTGAGEVHLGTITGTCNVTSGGGPLSIGDAFGSLIARTKVGDVIVGASRGASSLTTGGGIIRVTYSGGPTTLVSEGGDIIVRQAAGSVNAETTSGDISINVDPASKSQRLTAKTNKGNVAVNVSPRFGADIDLTVVTNDPDANSIKTDFPGLTFSREQVNGKTVVHATGKINGGGDRVLLYAEDGGIQFMSKAGALSSR